MEHKYPRPAVDVIIEMGNGEIVLVRRKNPPYGWTIPGGFVEYGESFGRSDFRFWILDFGLVSCPSL